MRRALWMVLDSFGIGGAPDARRFGDEGADTLGQVAAWWWREKGRALSLDHLQGLGLGEAYRLVHGCYPVGWEEGPVRGAWGAATEISTGKDTPSGHWEMAQVPVRWEWGYYPEEETFPRELLETIHRRAELVGSLGHCHASGTEIVARWGAESVRTGKPIFYTSADSVFQIAAHEEAFGLGRLYELCELVRELTREARIGRVIARPFVGEEGGYERTGNRYDYSLEPPEPTTLQRLRAAGREVVGVGKIADIFAHSGIGVERRASGHAALWRETRKAWRGLPEGGLVMVNFVDFDALYGHRRDVEGYGRALEVWDAELGRFLAGWKEGDLLLVTADHGNDPTWRGSDHTRERVPFVALGAEVGGRGIRASFADLGAGVAEWLGVPGGEGRSFLWP